MIEQQKTGVGHEVREFTESLGERRYYPGTLLHEFCRAGDAVEILQERHIAGGNYYYSDDGHNPCTIEQISPSGLLHLKQKGISSTLIISSKAVYWRKS